MRTPSIRPPHVSMNAVPLSPVMSPPQPSPRMSTYRKFLETEIRRLNDFETEERRIARGKVLPLKAAGGH